MSTPRDRVGICDLTYGERQLISQFIGQAYEKAKVPVWISTVGERGLACSLPVEHGGGWMVVMLAGFYLGYETEDYLGYGVPSCCQNGEAFIALALVRTGAGVEIKIRDVAGVPLGQLITSEQRDLLRALPLNWEHAAHLEAVPADF